MENKKTELAKFIDSTGKTYVPDKRLAIWEYEINDTNGIITLKLESDQQTGLEYLKNQLVLKFPEIKFDLSLLPDENLKDKTYGLINISTGNMRKKPEHSAELVNQELMGTPVKVFKKDDGWYLVQSPNGYVGWIDGPAISPRSTEEIKNLSKDFYVIFTKPYGQIFKDQQKTEPVSDIVTGSIIKVDKISGNIYQVSLPDGRKGYIEKEGFEDFKLICKKSKTDTSQMIRFAKTLIGTSYLWGGKSSKAIDCSGFTSMIYFFNGIILQRDASQQIKYGEEITANADYSDLRTGDLLFFGRRATKSKPGRVWHVGMYIGNGEFIHSSGLVRISSFIEGKENYDSSYVKIFLGARRILNSIGKEGIEKIEDNKYYQYFFK